MRKIKLDEIKNSFGATNWVAVKQQKDDDIEQKPKSSTDSRPLTDIELLELRRVRSEQSA